MLSNSVKILDVPLNYLFSPKSDFLDDININSVKENNLKKQLNSLLTI
jgi:hypothetical protein